MVPPPWSIASPHGAVHLVESVSQLKKLSRANGLVDASYRDKLQEVVDPKNVKAAENLPRHRCGWQLLQRVQWLEPAALHLR